MRIPLMALSVKQRMDYVTQSLDFLQNKDNNIRKINCLYSFSILNTNRQYNHQLTRADANTTYGVVSKTANGLAPKLPNETTFSILNTNRQYNHQLTPIY